MFGGINQTLVRQFRLPGIPWCSSPPTSCRRARTFTRSARRSITTASPGCPRPWSSGSDGSTASIPNGATIDRVRAARRTAPRSFRSTIRTCVTPSRCSRCSGSCGAWTASCGLMHEDLRQPEGEEGAQRELRDPPGPRAARPITQPLKTAFPIREELLQAPSRPLAVSPESTARLMDRFKRIPDLTARPPHDPLGGRASRGRAPRNGERNGRVQPFSLLLRSFEGRLMLRCVSPIRRSAGGSSADELGREALNLPVQVAIERGRAGRRPSSSRPRTRSCWPIPSTTRPGSPG